MDNHGFFGMGLKQGLRYDLSLYARTHADKATLRIELLTATNDTIMRKRLNLAGKDWKKYTLALTPKVTDAKGFLRISLDSRDGVDLDHISMITGMVCVLTW